VALQRTDPTSPIITIFEKLRSLHPNWYVELGTRSGDGWLPGLTLLNPSDGPLGDLLQRIRVRLRTDDRKIIAASFALRFGWASGVAIAPFLLYQSVPDVRLENVALKFSEQTFFERVSLVEPRGVIVYGGELKSVPSAETIEIEARAGASLDSPELIAHLRTRLIEQAEPVIDALYDWSRFSKRELWGQIASSWGAQFTGVLGHLNRYLESMQRARAFFDVPGFIRGMSPAFYPVVHRNMTRIYQRRASCCLYFRLPNTHYCASCPLVSQPERVERNKQWMEKGMG
jgi:hypothetical protein